MFVLVAFLGPTARCAICSRAAYSKGLTLADAPPLQQKADGGVSNGWKVAQANHNHTRGNEEHASAAWQLEYLILQRRFDTFPVAAHAS